MPKLENFANRIEIDGYPFLKNELRPIDEVGDKVSAVYTGFTHASKSAANDLYQLSYTEWTDSTDTPYASKPDLLSDMKDFFFRVVEGGGGGLTSDDIVNASNVSGATVTDALDELDSRELDKLVKVNQGNVASTLGGVIDSSKVYFIDGAVDVSGITITVPSTGITISGHGANISSLTSFTDNYTMFLADVGGAGDFIHREFSIILIGTNSKVYDLKSIDGASLYSALNIIYISCTDLGSIDNYAQGLETNTVRIGGSPQLELVGVWARGYVIDTSQGFGFNDVAFSVYKAGTGFVMNSRFRSNQNIDLSASSSFVDFAPSNFANSSTLQLIDCLISRDGVFNSEDANLTPNISASDLASFWDENTGLTNTYVGGDAKVTTEIETDIISSGVFYDLNGTWTTSDLQHFDSPANGQLRHLGTSPINYTISCSLDIDGGQNDELTARIMKYDNSLSSFVEVSRLTRSVNNFLGGRDVAFFTLIGNTTLSENDYVKLQISNGSDTTNVTAELESFLSVKER